MGELGQQGQRLREWDLFRDDTRTSPPSRCAGGTADVEWWSQAGVEPPLLAPSSADGEAGFWLSSFSLSETEFLAGAFSLPLPLLSAFPTSFLAALAKAVRFSRGCSLSPGTVALRL